MRIAIVSDIHGNRHAFAAVLAAAADAEVDAIWCLGDLVGYGAEPTACVELARRHADLCLAGNHDLAVTGGLGLADFSATAARAARWTREAIDPGARDWLAARAPLAHRDALGLYHASPRDPVWEYVVSPQAAGLCLDAAPERLVAVGHSHVALAFVRTAGAPTVGATRAAGESVDLSEGEWLLNPGSVGQPRDGDPRAAWLLLDRDDARATWRREAYDVAGAASAIRAAGLPDGLAERLSQGR